MQMYRLLVFSLLLFLAACSSSTNERGANSTQTTDNSSKAKSDVTQNQLKVNKKVIQFPSEDGLSITANVFEAGKGAPVLVLCHQASSAKEEYDESAPQLQAMGFSCIAPDQRSGGG